MAVFSKKIIALGAAGAAALVIGLAVFWPEADPQSVEIVPQGPALELARDIHVKPHRALYDLRLADAKSSSSVNNAGGQMMFVWGDTCDGWTVEQRLDLAFSYGEGGSQRVKTSLATWESKTGDQFRFNVRRAINGETKESFSGRAQLASDGSGEAKYTSPDGKSVKLLPKTLFPTVHTLQILKVAKAGEHQLTRSVFDGADEEGKNEVSAFIGNPIKVTAPQGVDNQMLRQGQAWPVSMAFYAPDNETGTPDYEMQMTLLENGVANDLLIDYGDFTVKATLHEVEPLPVPAC